MCVQENVAHQATPAHNRRMDLTQRLISDDEEEDAPLDKNKPLALLHVFKGTYGPAQDFNLYPGQNIIGRHASCHITLPSQSVSKKHAVLDVRPNCHILYDCGSLNKTRRGKVALPPNVRFALNSGDFLHFADVACRYTIFTDPVKEPEKEKPAVQEVESDDDSFVVPGTQAALAVEKTPGAAIRRMVQGVVLAKDSGDEDENKGEDVKSDARKGFDSSKGDHRTIPGAFLSPTTDTVVPESDEEDDASVSQHRYPSLGLRSDADSHDTSLVMSSQSFFTSPTPSDKKTRDPGPTREGSIASGSAGTEEKTLLGEIEGPPMEKKENGSDSDLSVIGPAAGEKDDLSTGSSRNPPKSDQEARTESSGAERNVAEATSSSHEDVKGDLSASKEVLEENESPGTVPESDSEVGEHTRAPPAETEAKSAIYAHAGNDDDDARASGTGKTAESEQHRDSRAGEGDDRGTAAEGKAKPTFHLDSDTDVEEEGGSPVRAAAKVRKATAILSDSDSDSEEASATNSIAGIRVTRSSKVTIDSDTDVEDVAPVKPGRRRKIARVPSDSDTDVEEEEEDVVPVKPGRRKRNIGRVASDSDTDVEGDVTSNQAETSPDSETDTNETAKSPLKAEATKEPVELNMDSDTDVEDATKSDNGLFEKPMTSACVEADVGEDLKTSGTDAGSAAAIVPHMDSDTDVEESEEEHLTTSSTAGSGTGVQTGNRETSADLEIPGEAGKASDDQDSGTSEKRHGSDAEFHMDTDTDVEEDDAASSVSVKDDQGGAGEDRSASTGAPEEDMDTTGSNLASDASVVIEEQKNAAEEMSENLTETAKKTEPEGTDLYMCETQCYLDESSGPEESDSHVPDLAEEPTQAFISSTYVEPDPFKRPADPIASLQISPVRANTSGDEYENAVAETQPYFCETETSGEECVQESETDTQPLPDPQTSEDDTQPLSQYLAATPALGMATCVSPRHEVPAGVSEEVAQVQECVEDEESSADEVATLAYSLAVPDIDEEATQAFIAEDDAVIPECNDSLNGPDDSSASGQTREEDSMQPRGVTEPAAAAGDETKVLSSDDQRQNQEHAEQEEAPPNAPPVDDPEESMQLHLSPSLVLTGQDAGDLRRSPPGRGTTDRDQSEEGGKRQEVTRDAAESEDENSSREDEDDSLSRSEGQSKEENIPQPSTSGDSGDGWKERPATQGKDVEECKEITSSEATTSETEPDVAAVSSANEKADLPEESAEKTDEWGSRDSAVQDAAGAESDVQEEGNNQQAAPEKYFQTEALEETEEMQSQSEAEAKEPVDLEGEDVAAGVSPSGDVEVKSEEEIPETGTLKASQRTSAEEVPGQTPEPPGDKPSKRKAKSTKRETDTNQEQQDTRTPEEGPARASRRTKSNLTGEGTREQKEADGKQEEVPVSRPVPRRMRKNSAGERASEQKEGAAKPEEAQASRPTSRRTRRNLEEEEDGKEKEETASRPVSRRTRTNSAGSGTSEQKEEPVGRPSTRRTRKNSAESGTSEQKEEPATTPASRRTKKNPAGSGTNEQKEEPATTPASRSTRKNPAGSRMSEQKEEPATTPASRSTRKNPAGSRMSEQKEEPATTPASRSTRKNPAGSRMSEQKEEPASTPASRRTRNNPAGGGTSEQKEEPATTPASRSTRKNPAGSRMSEQKEEPATTPASRRTKNNPVGSGTSEQKEEPATTPASRRIRKNSTGSGTSVDKSEDNPVSTRVSSRTRKTSTSEGTNVQKEDSDRSDGTQARGAVSRRTRKTADEGSTALKEGLEKLEKGPARPATRRGKNSGGGTKGENEKSEQGPSGRAGPRSTRKDARAEEEEKAERETMAEIKDGRQAARTDLVEIENGDPVRQAVCTRAKRGLKGAEGEKSQLGAPSQKVELVGRRKGQDEEDPSTAENDARQDDRSGRGASLRGRKNVGEDQKKRPNEAPQTEPRGSARTRKARAEESAAVQVATGGDAVEANEELQGDVATCPQVTTPLQTRKRGLGQKDGAVEVKRKKSTEEAEMGGGAKKTSPKPKGKRGRPRSLVVEAAEEDDGDIGSDKEALNPVPSLAGSGRRTEKAASDNSPADSQSRRHTSRALHPAGASRNYVSGLGAAPKVLFTGITDYAGEEVIQSLGGVIADSVFDCTHLVTDRVRRTVKFLCALARGVPIVTLDWIAKCKNNRYFLSPNGFLVSDKEQEKKFNFVLSKSLQQAKRKALFEGYEIHVTPNVKPEPEQMKDIIQCSGATFLPTMPKANKEKCVIVSCEEDAAQWKGVPSNVPITSVEFILSGILQQVVNPKAYLLDTSARPAAPTPAKRRR
uniref:Mediator of DNA damage checkpoint protein 1 n=1 Tax=Leptobrachium leishanense TaxID=445787 RepID=A0A8C5QP14_9ANUR